MYTYSIELGCRGLLYRTSASSIKRAVRRALELVKRKPNAYVHITTAGRRVASLVTDGQAQPVRLLVGLERVDPAKYLPEPATTP